MFSRILKVYNLIRKIIIILSVQSIILSGWANNPDSTEFRWGNSQYYNLDVGEGISFNEVEVKLLQIRNHFNQFKIGQDTLWLKVARGSLPEEINGIRIFVADNKKVKELTKDHKLHSLLKKDVLVCLSDINQPLLDPESYVFPVSFNDGFRWNAEEESYPFSFYREADDAGYKSYPGLGIDLHDARGIQKHWLLAIENSRVVWINSLNNETSILLESESQPGLYYVYRKLFTPNVSVKKGQRLVRGQVVGTAWGDKKWGHALIAVVKPESEPSPDDCFTAAVNCFPQFYGLYFRQGNTGHRFFTRGRITFGKPAWVDGNRTNLKAFEDFSGKGWLLNYRNPADKVEQVTRGNDGHVRLRKIMFEGTSAQFTNPDDYYEYRLNVRNGTYRIRAKIGDFHLPSWQKVEFEGVLATEKMLEQGNFDWTPERVVKVSDGSLNIRIYVDPNNIRVAGISEIVFQQVF